ncbi:MAG: hypothetical protein KAW84_06405 [Thermoplasmata archaeon]|nr:hypothetical protein [Thermoplasmata archaeon]
MTAVIGIAYPLLLSTLRSSIEKNEDWIVRLQGDIQERAQDVVEGKATDEELDSWIESRSEKAQGYLNTLEELLALEIFSSAFTMVFILCGLSFIVGIYSSLNLDDLWAVGTVVVFSGSVSLFFYLITFILGESALEFRERLKERIPERFSCVLTHEGVLFRRWRFEKERAEMVRKHYSDEG